MNFRGSLIQTTAACEQVCKTRVWTERPRGHPQAACPLHPAAWGPWSCLWPPSWPPSLARVAYLALANEREGMTWENGGACATGQLSSRGLP